MKRDMYNQDNLREEILNDTVPVINAPEIDEKPPVDKPQQALDDARRVKVMSPSMLVFKRFVRSKLAIAGCIILILMFSFAFLGGVINPYKQAQVFHKYSFMELDYGNASFRTEFSALKLNDTEVPTQISSLLNSSIKTFAEGETEKILTDSNDNEYTLTKLGAGAFVLDKKEFKEVVSYDTLSKVFTYTDESYHLSDFETFIKQQVASNPSGTVMFMADYGGKTFKFARSAKTFRIKEAQPVVDVILATNMVFDYYTVGNEVTNAFKYEALKALYDSKTFVFEEKTYEIGEIDGYVNTFAVNEVFGEEKIPFANITNFVVRRYNGEDTLSISYKLRLQRFVNGLIAESQTKGEFSYYEENGVEIVLEEDGDTKNIYKVEKKLDDYVVRNEQNTYLIDIYGPPSAAHPLGTDANGMDVLTRMMYGGRISLMIGFIVILIETVIGVILGGIAGYFGKWIDNLIMRLVDIFNCIPYLPILIIIGSVFDKLQMDSYDRIMYLMIILGVLGWPSVARLVRGQILSLREQEFMIAAEATGISAKRRIFRHLVPNVMPQLIVTATMGLGSIIITESTLSFLGLGAKYPLATWGAMINSVSDAASLVNYTYIWIPVGLLICLTVIAFNFVGDGLRDAFDPKMKR